MFGVSKADFDLLLSRMGKQEDMMGSLQPRVASLEYPVRGVDANFAYVDSRIQSLEGHSAGRDMRQTDSGDAREAEGS